MYVRATTFEVIRNMLSSCNFYFRKILSGSMAQLLIDFGARLEIL